MEYVNYTGKDLVMYNKSEAILLGARGNISLNILNVQDIDNAKVVIFSGIDIPKQQDNVSYIVNKNIAEIYLADRTDLVYPTNKVKLKDEFNNTVIAYTDFASPKRS